MKECACGCGKSARKGGKLSSACYMRQYRKTEKGKSVTREAHRRWRKKHGKWWDTVYKTAWRKKNHFYVHEDIKALRKACKNLEGALANSSLRKRAGSSSEPDSHYDS